MVNSWWWRWWKGKRGEGKGMFVMVNGDRGDERGKRGMKMGGLVWWLVMEGMKGENGGRKGEVRYSEWWWKGWKGKKGGLTGSNISPAWIVTAILMKHYRNFPTKNVLQ
jgi:hypothetical protein